MEKLKDDILKIEGFVEIRNGDTVIKAKNRFTQVMIQHICNMISWSSTTAPQQVLGPINSENIYLGINTTTPTAYNTTVLANPIGIAPGTAPNLLLGNTSNPSDGVFQMSISATWNSGTVSGTVGEMALYLNMFAAGNLQTFQWSGNYNPGTIVLASRLSVADADGSFPTPFFIDNTKPLVVTWTLQVSF